jgi:hypothetical protein
VAARTRVARRRNAIISWSRFAQYLDASNARISPEVIAQLFPSGYRTRLLQAAGDLAARGHYREAVQLGTRVFHEIPRQRAHLALELARWHVFLGELAPARELLRACVAEPGESFSSPVYGVIRALYLLLPAEERAAFVQETEAALDERIQPLHATLTHALLAALGGDDAAARAALDRLLALRAVAPGFDDERATGGDAPVGLHPGCRTQLSAWQFDSLAIHLWLGALADDAAIALQVQLPEPARKRGARAGG